MTGRRGNPKASSRNRNIKNRNNNKAEEAETVQTTATASSYGVPEPEVSVVMNPTVVDTYLDPVEDNVMVTSTTAGSEKEESEGDEDILNGNEEEYDSGVLNESDGVVNASLIVNVSDNSFYVNSLNTTKDPALSTSVRKDLSDLAEEISEEFGSPPETARSAPPDLNVKSREEDTMELDEMENDMPEMLNLNNKHIELLKKTKDVANDSPLLTSTPKPTADAANMLSFDEDYQDAANGNDPNESKKTVTFAEVVKNAGDVVVVGDYQDVIPEVEPELMSSVYYSLAKSPTGSANVSAVSNADDSTAVNGHGKKDIATEPSNEVPLASSMVVEADITLGEKSLMDLGSVSTRFDGEQSSETLMNVSSWETSVKVETESKIPSESAAIPVVKGLSFERFASGDSMEISSSGNVDDIAADEEVDKINAGLLLPTTVIRLVAPNGTKVYVVGTAHFSEESQKDVIETIEKLQPTLVMLELCSSRRNILTLDEETILRESADMSLRKVKDAINQSGAVQGALHLILLSMSAHLTKKLGMAPGGEFRAAVRAAQAVPSCTVILGDRPFRVTLSRALAALTFGQKIKLAWQFLTSNDDITKDVIERCKEKDLLEKLMMEMTGEFPAMSDVFVKERDAYLAHSLWMAATSPSHRAHGGPIVGVVGLGHVAGISRHWGQTTDEEIDNYMIVPEPSVTSVIVRAAVRYTFYIAIGYGAFKICSSVVSRLPREGITSMYDNVVKQLPALPSLAPRA